MYTNWVFLEFVFKILGFLENKRDKHYSFQKVALVRLIYDLIEKYHD